jgi:long-chain acyl-CoA synthetase
MNLAALLFDLARRLPEQPAVVSQGLHLTFRELAARTAAVAGGLRAIWKLAPGDRVLLSMENCGEFFELLFGCWTAGLTVIPVNAKLHPKEVDYIANAAQAKLAVTTPGLIEGLEIGRADYARLLAAAPIAPHPVNPEDLAWLFYTSGTTGRPKGAMLSHRNLLFMSHCFYADVDFVDERDTVLHAAPLSHGAGLYGLPTILKGARQAVLGGAFEPARVFDAISRYPNASFFAAPTMLTRLLHHPGDADLGHLKTIFYGGAPMYVADLKRAIERFGPHLYQLYGQGESPMTITGLTQRQHLGASDATLASAGYARTGVAVRVVDDADRDLPPGAIGEIVTRSDCVMAGYLADAEATARTLRGGWLHTGDLGSMAADGLLTLHDRSKDMLISGGSNIYPREIEEVLLRHPDVAEAAVVGRPHSDWGEEVVAFIVPRAGRQVTEAALDALCLDNIARYKRPRHYRFVASLPKNNYGKVLKTELRRLVADSASGEAGP